MDGLQGILDQIIAEPASPPVSGAEMAARTEAIGMLFDLYAKPEDEPKLRTYVMLTEEIPAYFLAVAIKGICRAHKWSNLPTPGELWEAARYAAGMHRQQYRAGQYLPPATNWPPPGKRHAVPVNELESMPPALAIAQGTLASHLLTEGE